MPRFMSRYSSRRYARCKVYFLAQPQCLGTRIVMIAQHPWSGLDCYIAKALRIEQPARHLGASDSVLGADLRILRNIDFDARLRIRAQQQTRKNKYPKNRVSQHFAISPVSGAHSAISIASWAHSAPLRARAYSARSYRMRWRRHPIRRLPPGANGSSKYCRGGTMRRSARRGYRTFA